MISARLVSIFVDPYVKLIPRQREPSSDPDKYQKLINKINYFATGLGISFFTSVLSQFLESS